MVLLLIFGDFFSCLHILGKYFLFRGTLYFLYLGQASLLYLAPWQAVDEDLSHLLPTRFLAKLAVEGGRKSVRIPFMFWKVS
jgi:hypothetical protein